MSLFDDCLNHLKAIMREYLTFVVANRDCSCVLQGPMASQPFCCELHKVSSIFEGFTHWSPACFP